MTTIQITEKHIRDGRKGQAFHCPLALAVSDVCLVSAEVSVAIHLTIRVAGRLWQCDLDDAEWGRVGYFDAGRGMYPHALQLPEPIPAWALRATEGE